MPDVGSLCYILMAIVGGNHIGTTSAGRPTLWAQNAGPQISLVRCLELYGTDT